jgi:ubiquinone/menaquinone biosynthesis C-methylase UbiE
MVADAHIHRADSARRCVGPGKRQYARPLYLYAVLRLKGSQMMHRELALLERDPPAAWLRNCTDRQQFYDNRAPSRSRESARAYHRLLRRYYSFLVPNGARVLEVGCGLGDLLAAVEPQRGVGIDFSQKTLDLAQQRHSDLKFEVAEATEFQASESFDYIVLSDLVNDLPDVQAVLTHLHDFANPGTRLVINFFNYLWQPILATAEKLGLKAPTLRQNWLSTADMKNLLYLSGWQIIKEDARILWPIRTPILEPLLNRWLAPSLRHFCLTIFLVARPNPGTKGVSKEAEGWKEKGRGWVIEDGEWQASSADRSGNSVVPMASPSIEMESAPVSDYGRSALPRSAATVGEPVLPLRKDYRCTVVIPARNEAGNIEAAVQRTPQMGLGTEIIFVEGHSKDKTWEEIQRVVARHPDRDIKTLKQKSKGKGGAVREAFAAATGDILFILDADLTMPPEELPKFYEVLRSGTAEFVNGVRLVYPMERESMRFLNMVANKCFSLAFSWILGQPIKDTLCGTKVLFLHDYEAITRNRAYFGDFDPFGDFDLLFGAAKLNLHIVDLPIRYCARTYGDTNIQRWRHGWLLLQMTLFAARRLKFIG